MCVIDYTVFTSSSGMKSDFPSEKQTINVYEVFLLLAV